MIDKTLKRIWDTKASLYDDVLNSDILSNYVKLLSFDTLIKYFKLKNGNFLLDLGCGTGREAIRLAQRGFKVFGIDISPEMIKISKKKVTELNITKSPTFKDLPIEKLHSLKPMIFDGIYSSLGPLNCVINISKFAENVSKILKPGGFFISSLVNKFYLSEVIYYFLRVKPSKIIKRWIGNPVHVKMSKFEPAVPCNFYNPRQFYNYFKSEFILEEIKGFPILIPPINIIKENSVLGKFYELMMFFEKKINNLPILRNIGDHFTIVMRKK